MAEKDVKVEGVIESAEGRKNTEKPKPFRQKRKVMAIVVASPLTQNIYDRIGAEVVSKCFDVVVIDCLDWIRKYDKRPVYKEVDAQGIYKVDSRIDLQVVFRLTSPAFVLDFVGRGKYTRQIQDVCREVDALYITQLLTPFPDPASEKALLQLFLSNPLAISYKIIRYILRQFIEDKPLPPDVALLAGLNSNGPWTETARHKIFTATPDYFDLRQIKRNSVNNEMEASSLLCRNYILFIDDCLALSFDFALGTYKPIFEAGEYFSRLIKLFDRLEKHFMMSVIIAAHPNGKEFGGYKELFGGRTVLFDSTGTLSLHCHFAMTHYSSAISYPVLLRKKIMLINSKKFKRLKQGVAVDYMCKQLHCIQIDMDRFDDSELSMLEDTSVVESCYDSYQNKYIASMDVSGENSFEALLEYLSSLP